VRRWLVVLCGIFMIFGFFNGLFYLLSGSFLFASVFLAFALLDFGALQWLTRQRP